MELPPDDEKLIRRFLLGELPPESQGEIEERLLTDDEWFDAIGVGEDELIEEYLDGRLSGTERKAFTEHFLRAPQRREKMRFARALERRAVGGATLRRRQPDAAAAFAGQGPISLAKFIRAQSPANRFAAAAALALMLAGGAWLSVSFWKLNQEHQRLLATLGSREGAVRQTVSLQPSLFRSGGTTQRVSLSPTAALVEFQLDVGVAAHAAYQATLRSADGREILRQSFLKASQTAGTATVGVQIPAPTLSLGDYYIELAGVGPSGVDTLGQYGFRVVP